MFFNSLLNILPCRKLTVSSVYLALLLLLFNLPVLAAAGDLDRSFGQDGITLPVGGSFTSAFSLAVQADGKILAGGYAGNSFAVARFFPNGALDTNFGNGGRVTTAFTEFNAFGGIITDLAVLTDGKIVAVGEISVPDLTSFRRNLMVVRYNADGSIDTTFNGTGKYMYAAGGLAVTAQGVAALAGGKFLVAGYAGGTFDGNVPYKPLLFRFGGSGLDSTFGNGGIVVTQVSSTNGIKIGSLALQPDGKIVTGGIGSAQTGIGINLIRYNADGSIDTSFGNNGFVLVDDNHFILDNVTILIQPDGEILAAATYFIGGNTADFAVLRFNSDGSPDADFGTNGRVVTSITNAFDDVLTAALQENGRIIIAGFSRNNDTNTYTLAMARYHPDGSLDRAFGIGGVVRAQAALLLSDVIIQPNEGKILAATLADADPANGFRVLRFLANGTREFDFDGDRRADVSIFRPNSSAEWHWLNSSNNQSSGLQFGNGTDKPVSADYDGDGKSDLAVFRNGDWYRINSSDNQFVAAHFGQAGDIPVPADFDGDSRADLAVYRSGVWYILNSGSNSFRAEQFGVSTDKPVIGDFDGDGKSDLTVYRDGTWYAQRSRDGFFGAQFGINTDKPVAADYDSDGKTDLAVYRPSDGTWYLLRSHLGFTATQFGIATDKPVPADYDGDGKTDLAVYRDGDWYLQQSSNGFAAKQFGTSNDNPVPNAFVP
jgi:uncharacterized delta-60 repeat protein